MAAIASAAISRRPMIEDGYYWIRFFPDDTEWQPARLEAGAWFLIGVADGMPRVAEVGLRIEAFHGFAP